MAEWGRPWGRKNKQRRQALCKLYDEPCRVGSPDHWYGTKLVAKRVVAKRGFRHFRYLSNGLYAFFMIIVAQNKKNVLLHSII